nr:chromate resistance protein ChrB domain-containing protein [uncultured Tolumonas sp.]
MHLYSLILSLPTENATARQRIWRSLKSSGAAVLRDGVYLMPNTEAGKSTLLSFANEISELGGTAHVFHIESVEQSEFIHLFDRSADYADLVNELSPLKLMLSPDNVHDVLKHFRKLRKTFTAIASIDFFPNEAQKQAEFALTELESACSRILSPNEPTAINKAIERLNPNVFRDQVWATRERPWVDRLASAWLIKQFIDKEAQFLWLKDPSTIPENAIGFDFDGARFTHVEGLVTFEVLVRSFELDTPAMSKLSQIVHFLDVGGIQPTEAAGIESILVGMRTSIHDDDLLLQTASSVFDGLLASFNKG